MLALDRAPTIADARTRAALFEYVDVLAAESTPPESVVISLKEMIQRAPAVHRLEPLLRDQIRAALVSASIDRYFTARDADDVQSSTRGAAAVVHRSVGVPPGDEVKQEHPRA